jgi:hypothetical protein
MSLNHSEFLASSCIDKEQLPGAEQGYPEVLGWHLRLRFASLLPPFRIELKLNTEKTVVKPLDEDA